MERERQGQIRHFMAFLNPDLLAAVKVATILSHADKLLSSQAGYAGKPVEKTAKALSFQNKNNIYRALRVICSKYSSPTENFFDLLFYFFLIGVFGHGKLFYKKVPRRIQHFSFPEA